MKKLVIFFLIMLGMMAKASVNETRGRKAVLSPDKKYMTIVDSVFKRQEIDEQKKCTMITTIEYDSVKTLPLRESAQAVINGSIANQLVNCKNEILNFPDIVIPSWTRVFAKSLHVKRQLVIGDAGVFLYNLPDPEYISNGYAGLVWLVSCLSFFSCALLLYLPMPHRSTVAFFKLVIVIFFIMFFICLLLELKGSILRTNAIDSFFLCSILFVPGFIILSFIPTKKEKKRSMKKC